MTLDFLESFKPDRGTLLRRISAHIDDETLQAIAKTDPTTEAADHVARLRLIRDRGVIEKPLLWTPREVLNLGIWAEPDDPGRDPEELHGAPGHWARAFCCAALVSAYGDIETREIEHMGYSLALVQLVESLRRLNAGLEPEAMAAVSWHIKRLAGVPDGERELSSELAFFGVALLWLAMRSAPPAPDPLIVALTDWLVAEERQDVERSGGTADGNASRWLFRTDHIDMLDHKWRALGTDLAACDRDGACGDAVRAIGQAMIAPDRSRRQ